MRIRYVEESRPRGVDGNRDYHFSLALGDGRAVFCLGSFFPDSAPDAVKYFTVEMEHYAQVRAKKAWMSAGSAAMLLDLAMHADGLLSASKGSDACGAGFFGAVLAGGVMDYLSVGDGSAAVWDEGPSGTGGRVRFVETGLSQSSAWCLPLKTGRRLDAADVQTISVPPGSAVFLFSRGACWGGLSGRESRARLMSVAGTVYGERTKTARRMLDAMLESWDRGGDFTGLVVELQPHAADALAEPSQEIEAWGVVQDAESFRHAVQDLVRRLEGRVAEAESRIERAVARALDQPVAQGAQEIKAVGEEIALAVEAARRALEEAMDRFEVKVGEAVAGFSMIVAKLDKERLGIQALEKRLQTAVRDGLGRLEAGQAGKRRDERGFLPLLVLVGMLFLVMIGGAGVGIYGYTVFFATSGERSPVAAIDAKAGGVSSATGGPGFQAERVPGPGDKGMVNLKVAGMNRSVPVLREVLEAGQAGRAGEAGMDQVADMLLETLRRGGYGREDAKNVIAFLLNARDLDAGRRLELLNFMAFSYLFANNGIDNYEDRSWAVNVFMDRFPLDAFENPGRVGGKPGVLEVRLSDDTFEKLAQWKNQGDAPQKEAVPIILQFLFVNAGEGSEPVLIDGRWGADSSRRWRRYVDALRERGVPGAEDWAGKDPLQPLN